MIYVYYSLIDPDMPDAAFRQQLDQFPLSIQQDVLRYHQRADQVRVLTGKILLHRVLVQYGLSPALLSSIEYSNYKRPYINGAPDFNITHSGNCVAIAAGIDMKVGIDVEHIHPLKPADIAAVFRDEELQQMEQGNASPETILRFWTRKEAIVKASGEGLYMAPQTIYFKDDLTATANGQTWYLHELNFGDEYVAYCTTNVAGVELQIKKI